MKGNKYNSMLKANILLERSFIHSRNILKESSGEMEIKKQTMITNLESLKKDNPSFATKFDKHINALKSADVANACEGNKLKVDLQSKLSDAKSDLSMKSLLKDTNKVIPTLESDIKFIEGYCTTKESNTGGTLPPPSPTTTIQPSKNTTTPTQDLEPLKKMDYKSALELMKNNDKYSKEDVIRFVSQTPSTTITTTKQHGSDEENFMANWNRTQRKV